MQRKYETYEQLFAETLGGLTDSGDKWLKFLETASRMYKYSFEDQLLIYAQKPETRACADFSFWTAVNRMNRQLRQGCTEIALLDQEKRKLHYVYAMEDTEPKTNGKSRNPEHYIWQLSPDNRDVINDMLCRQGGINSNNIEKTIISMTSSMTKLKMAEYISEFDNIYHGLDVKSPKSAIETAIAEIVAASAAYMTAKRTGTDVSNYLNMDCFSKLSLIDNPELTAFLGRVTTDTAGAVLKLIERNVNEHKIQERSSENEQLTKGENRERNTLRSERGNNDISPNISREQRGRNSDNTPLRQDEGEVSQGELQSNIQQNADVRRVNSSSGIDRRTSSDNGRTDNIGNGESGRNRRGAESERPDEVGRSDEQLQNVSTGDNNQGTDRSILSKEAEEIKPSASSVNEEAVHNAFNELNLNHSFSAEQKLFFERIEQFATKNNVTENIIDRAFSERPVYRRTYGNRENLSKKMFEHSLKVLESELERAIRKNLAENNEKIAVSIEQETSEAMNVHSEKTEGQEMVKEVTKSMYQTDNPDVLIIDGKGSLAKIDITPTEELWNRLAEKGIVRTNESVDRIIFNTDNLNWNKLVIPDKWGNMTNNIDIDKVFTENEVRIAQSVADDVITPTLEGSQLSMFDEHITDDIILPTEEAPEEVLQVNEFENKQSEIIQDNTTKTDFTITDDKLGEGGAKTKFRANVEAIKTLKTIEAEERTATPEEQEILSKYVGWGGLKNAFEDFHDDWKKEFAELKELLTPEEYKLAKASVLNAHYTSPLVIEKMYEALRSNGFTGGKILEPAMGIGNYFGKMPEDIRSSSNLYGVELDDISGRIAKQLYQNANIRITGFEKTLFKDNSFDLAIGNVPFGAYSLNEPKYNKYYFQIHDHFFAKALDKVKPGGIVAFITSKGTLDKKNPDVRKYLAERAELVGAIRLPNNAFKNNAGTEVTSDIIFLQKRETPIELTPLTTPDWVHLGKTDNGLPVNQYFIDNPQMVLGNIVAGNKLYGHGNDDTMCEAIEGADLSEQLSEAIKHINFEVLEKREEMAVEDTIAEIPSGIKNFSYAVINDKIYYRNNDEMELFSGKKSDIPRIKAMVDIRDTLRELIACQLDNGSDEQLHELQAKLNTVYDSFVAKYGRLNDKINVKAIKEDSSAPLLSSLEIYKGEEFSGKAAIFEKRTILAKNDVTSADTSSEALTLSLAKKACVDMEYMQELTGFSEEKILSELKGVVFENPIKKDENGKPRLEASDEYLSGNIRTKLEYMKTFHADDSRYAHNIAALEAAMPSRIEAADIDVKLGSPCVKPEIIQQFMYETFNTPRYKQDFGLGYKDSVTVQYADINSTWFIPNKSSEKNNTAANSKFGTQRCSAYELLEDCLNLKNTVVKDTVERDGKRVYVLNQTETEFAQEKQRQLQETFKNWIFADPVRREEVVETYNRMFNSIRPREYDGSVLEFPGMNNEIQLRKHQRDAVAHALYGGNTLFAHEVGAGKTFEMIAAAMEGKRLGLHHKAMICVPNHLTEQIGADFIKLYPNANVLVATSKDFTKNNRRKLFGKIATGDYDGIIIGHSQLVNLPVSKERQQNLMEREIDEIVTAIAALKSQSGQDYQVKQLERTKKSLEAKLEKLIEAPRRDDVVDFEELGIDKLILDEAHEFKNLFIATKMGNISGISTNDDVQKTFDLYLKCQYLDEITNNKGLIFATGTPVSNSISEIYNMQKYLQSDLLRETGLNHFDMWAANFAETVTESQLSPEGNKYQMKTRFAKFNNLPELMALFKECADIKTADMLGLKTPECTMHSVVAQPSGIQKAMIENLAERAKRIRLRQVDRKDDNMPMITNDGRKIGLDQRLMNPDLPDDKNSKLNTCINNVYDIWDKTSDKKLTQVIFCDLGVPQNSNDKKKKGERFSVYDDIKNKLIEKGVPADEIAFIHDAATEEAKDKLFAKVRKGDVRVIIGSTKKMGTGTNIQTKLVALHDLDAPWRPADMEQRRGRMVRQGNENEHVDHFRYVTEGTFDAYLYQMLENKQKFISQIMTSKSPVRSCQDMDEVTLSYAEVKALSAGNPLIKEKMDLDIEVSKLKMLKSAHENNLYKLQNEVTTHLPMKIQYLKNEINGITADIEKAKKSPITYDSDGKAVFPSIEINGKVFTDKEEAGKALIAVFQAAVEKDYSKNHEIGNYRGFKLLVGYNPLEKSYGGMLQGEAKHITTLGGSETGNFTRLDNLISTMDRRLIDAQRKLDGLVVELEEAKTQLDVPFPREEELREKTKRLDELTKMLEADADDNLAVADNTSEKTTSITDPYYLGECTPGAISILEKNDIYFETNIIEDKPHVKINAKDKNKVHALLEERPKLTL